MSEQNKGKSDRKNSLLSFFDNFRQDRTQQLLNEFKKNGFSNPEVAVDVVRFLESRLTMKVPVLGKHNLDTGKRANEPYEYETSSLESLKNIVEGIDDPVGFLNDVSKILFFKIAGDLETIGEFVKTIKKNPEARKIIQQIADVGLLTPTFPAALQIDATTGVMMVVDYRKAARPKSTELITALLDMPRDERELLLSPDTLSRLKIVNKLMVELSQPITGLDTPVFAVQDIPMLLKIAQDEDTFQLFLQWKNTYNTENGRHADVAFVVADFVSLIEAVPEVVQIYANGLSLDTDYGKRFLNCESEVSYMNVQERIKFAQAHLLTIRQSLNQPNFLENARLLKEYSSENLSLFDEGVVTLRIIEPEVFERMLILKDALTGWLYEGSVGKTAQHAYLDFIDAPPYDVLTQVSTEELINWLSSLAIAPEHKLMQQVAFFKNIDSKNELRHRIRTLTDERFVVIHQQRKTLFYLSEIGMFRSVDKVKSEIIMQTALEDIDTVWWLAQQGETEIKRKYEFFRSLGTRIQLTPAEIRELLELPDAQRNVITKFLKPHIDSLDRANLAKLRVIWNLPPAEQDELQNLLDYFHISSFSYRYLTPELVTFFISPDGKKVVSTIAQFKEATKDTDGVTIFSETESLSFLQFFMYLIKRPDEFDKIVAVLKKSAGYNSIGGGLKARSRLVSLNYICEQMPDSDFSLSAYFNHEGVESIELLDVLFDAAGAGKGVGIQTFRDILQEAISEKSLQLITDDSSRLLYWFIGKWEDHLTRAELQFYAKHRDKFSTTNGYPCPSWDGELIMHPQFIREYALELPKYEHIAAYFLQKGSLAAMPEADRNFWTFWEKLSQPRDRVIRSFLLNHYDEFSSLVIDGKETKAFWHLFAQENTDHFLSTVNKEGWVTVFGEAGELFLNAVGDWGGDERRNAFVHNDYDRTTEFLLHLLSNAETFQLNPDELEIITAYVRSFGLAKSGGFYNLFRNLYLRDHRGQPLPKDIESMGIQTMRELIDQWKQINQQLLAEVPMRGEQLLEMSELQMSVAEVVTGHSSHRFPGRQQFPQIVQDFAHQSERLELSQLPEGYDSFTISPRKVSHVMDLSTANKAFEVLSKEIIAAIEESTTPPSNLLESIIGVFELKTANLEEKLTRTAEEEVDELQGLQFQIEKLRALVGRLKDEPMSLVGDMVKTVLPDIQRQIEELASAKYEATAERQTRLRGLQTTKEGLDHLLERANRRELSLETVVLITIEAINTVNLGGKEAKRIAELLRQLIIRHVLSEFHESDRTQLRYVLSSGLSRRSLKELYQFIDVNIIDHALSLRENDSHWSDDVLAYLRLLRRRLEKAGPIVESQHRQIQATIDSTEVITSDELRTVHIIPDRGFAGEVSAYLANVCYSAEYPLLRDRPNLVPFKFVIHNQGTGEKEFYGSVLVFEVDDADGNKCMLVRAFNVPNEDNIDIKYFIENFLDNLARIAEARGIQRILVPGLEGATSNYRDTIKHFQTEYVIGKKPVNLANVFRFNNYPLTNNCYEARRVGELVVVSDEAEEEVAEPSGPPQLNHVREMFQGLPRTN